MSHKFKLGERVRRAHIGYADARLLSAQASAKSDVADVFEIIRLVPEDQTGEPAYRIKSASGERAVREGEITAA